MDIEQVIEAWRTNNRINLFLIDKISDEGMKRTLSTRGTQGRSGLPLCHLGWDRF